MLGFVDKQHNYLMCLIQKRKTLNESYTLKTGDGLIFNSDHSNFKSM